MMNKSWIRLKTSQAHKNAVEKGFYPEDEEKDISELLMLLISEIGEAVEAHRRNKLCLDLNNFVKCRDSGLDYSDLEVSIFFEKHIKNTFEDEMADIFIRLFDLCDYLKIKLYDSSFEKHRIIWLSKDNVASDLFRLTQIATKIYCFNGNRGLGLFYIPHLFAHLIDFCRKHQIPIKDHIEAKMEYNKTRAFKHGKGY